MKSYFPHTRRRGSVLVVVLWIAFGLVTITLYFANSMSLELRASDNRVSGVTADQAIEGAARYVAHVLSTLGTNGSLPNITLYQHEAVPVGDAHFWLIGRNNNQSPSDQVSFGLVDEASKLNLNTVTTNMLENLPNITSDMLAAIPDWRNADSDGSLSASYALMNPPYGAKHSPFETVDELRLVIGASMDVLVGEDANRNGILDANENDNDRSGLLDSGILEYVTVYSREPNTRGDGSVRINPSDQQQLIRLLQEKFDTTRTNQILIRLGPPTTQFRGPLEFFIRSGMEPEEFVQIANDITVAMGSYIDGRINVNTAGATVLACLPGFTSDIAQQLVTYRQTNPDNLTSIAWVVDALGQNTTTLQSLQAGDYITTQSYQFSADVAALGPHGRGYRRNRFIFDTSEGVPRIIYRQDLGHLGWALGKDVRQIWLLAKSSP